MYPNDPAYIELWKVVLAVVFYGGLLLFVNAMLRRLFVFIKGLLRR